jgi:hypothetical protein
MYAECFELLVELTKNGYEIPRSTVNWLNSRTPLVKKLLSRINPLWQYEKELSTDSDEWPHLIQRVGLILGPEFPYLLNGYKDLVMPVENKTVFAVKKAVSNLRRLQLIWMDIQNEEYKRLWTKKRYETT